MRGLKKTNFREKGFTFTQVLIIIAILSILTTISVLSFRYIQKESDLNNNAEEIKNSLKLAQNKTLASEGASQYGVYFDNSSSPHKYTLFQGSSYSSRNSLLDEIGSLSQTVEIYELDFSGGQEVVFDRLVGTTSQPGNVSLRLKSDTSKIRGIYIDGSGKVETESLPAASDTNRIKDSRHVHFDYGREISTSETMTLTFYYDSSEVVENILISENMEDGQIYWEGEVDVDGQIQILKIHTHRFNSPDTQFCIHRDKRYNNKALKISLSGDVSGSILEYSADGSSTTYTSINVSNLVWQ